MIDANDLERMAKERPNERFLKGSGVVKLIGGIRQLEAEVRELRAAEARAVQPTEQQIMEMAAIAGMVTGENQRKHDGYYYRSQGTPTNVRGSDLIAFAEAVRAWKPGTCIPCGGTGSLGSVSSQRFMDCPDCSGTGGVTGPRHQTFCADTPMGGSKTE